MKLAQHKWNWPIAAAVLATLIAWGLWPSSPRISPEGSRVSADEISQDLGVLLPQLGGRSGGVLYFDLEPYLASSLVPEKGVRANSDPRGPEPQLLYVIIRGPGVTSGGLEPLVAEQAAATWRYLHQREPIMPIGGVVVTARPSLTAAAHTCVYLSRERFLELLDAAGPDAPTAAIAAQVWSGHPCPRPAQWPEVERRAPIR